MNSFAVVAFFAAIAAASAGLLAPAASVLQGPSSRTTLVGPEGSVISSVAPGGQVITDSAPGVVAYSAPAIAAAPLVSAYSAPVVSSYAAPLVTGGVIGARSVIAGPSGTIATGSSLAAPAVATYAAPAVVAARSILV
ncbi:hypothetical protein NQ318_018689 [Aromia moschata]|uniref:Uncharacterized protein n=1 Tax=Aromia moschata TaxID=1265417 RepID=A0AAV8ZG81_9CUCU|nr:hypothetical protein NQ318_018689 [Aromia moschata]